MERAAEQGKPEAQLGIEAMYFGGLGVERSFEKARGWFVRAAEQGSADAQLRLGIMHDNGFGAEQSDDEAFRWYTLSADQGVPEACLRLGMMYLDERGTKRDEGIAFGLIRTAAESGNPEAEYRLGTMYEDGIGISASPKDAAKWYRRAMDDDGGVGRLAGMRLKAMRGKRGRFYELFRTPIARSAQGTQGRAPPLSSSPCRRTRGPGPP